MKKLHLNTRGYLLLSICIFFNTQTFAFFDQFSFISELPLSYNSEFSFQTNDNVSRAQSGSDIESDSSASAQLSTNYFQGIGNKAALVINANLGIEEFSSFSKLSNTQWRVTGSYLYQPVISFTAIRYRAFAELINTESASALRDSFGHRFGFEINKTFTTKIQATAGYSIQSQDATGDVFDIDLNRLFFNVDYTLNNKTALYFTYNDFSGDIVSTATPSLTVIENNDALAPDDVFGGLNANKIAYRLDANTTILNLGSNYALDSQNAIDVSLELLDSKAAGGIYYDRQVVNVSYLKNF